MEPTELPYNLQYPASIPAKHYKEILAKKEQI
jgi:hypothetical protein